MRHRTGVVDMAIDLDESRGLTGWLFGFWCRRALNLEVTAVGGSLRTVIIDYKKLVTISISIIINRSQVIFLKIGFQE